VASGGMTLWTVPALSFPTVRTKGSTGSTSREATVWRATMAWAATRMGSTASWGLAPWPPRPRMVA
jgi:hypothetical protein